MYQVTPSELAAILHNKEVLSLIDLAFEEDGVGHDVTGLCADTRQRSASGQILVKSRTVLAGEVLARIIVDQFNKIYGSTSTQPVTLSFHAMEGNWVEPGTVWLHLKGMARDLLRLERTLLNFLMRSCGIATQTRQLLEAMAPHSCKLLHTRKTAPGHRRSDIAACLLGGAHPHRRSLDDAILVKENHFRTAPHYQELFSGIQKYRDEVRFVEIEVTNMTELKHSLAAKPDRIMLDNFAPADIRKAVELFGSSVELEASGGIHLGNIAEYAATGVDYISTGSMTHSTKAADLSLLFEI